MFELNLFNIAQFLDQGIAIIGTYLLTSLSAKARMYGFIAVSYPHLTLPTICSV